MHGRSGNSDAIMLENIRRIRRATCSDSVSDRILLRFYPDRTLCIGDIPVYGWRFALMRLAKRNYLRNIDGSRVRARYRITLQGRCRVLCNGLQTAFLGLCILTEAYVTHRCQEGNGCLRSYVLNGMHDSFYDIYPRKTVQNAASELKSRGLADSVCPGVICLRDDAMERLAEYGETLDELHCWIAGVPNMLDTMSVGDPGALHRTKGTTRWSDA